MHQSHAKKGSTLVPLMLLVMMVTAVIIANCTLMQGLLQSGVYQKSEMSQALAQENTAAGLRAALRQTIQTPAASYAWSDFSAPATTYLNFAGLDGSGQNWTLDITDMTGSLVGVSSYTPFNPNNAVNLNLSASLTTPNVPATYWSPKNPYTLWSGSVFVQPISHQFAMTDSTVGMTYNFEVDTLFTELQCADVPFVSYNQYDDVDSLIPVVVNGDALLVNGRASDAAGTESTNMALSVTGHTVDTTKGTSLVPLRGSWGLSDPTHLMAYPPADAYETQQSYISRAYAGGHTYTFTAGVLIPDAGAPTTGMTARQFDGVTSLYIDTDQLQPDDNVYYYIHWGAGNPAGTCVVVADPTSLNGPGSGNPTSVDRPIVIITDGPVTARSMVASNVTRPVVIVTNNANLRLLSSEWLDSGDNGAPPNSVSGTAASGYTSWTGRFVLLAPHTVFNSSYFINNEDWTGTPFTIYGSLAVDSILTGPVNQINVENTRTVGTVTRSTAALAMGPYGERYLYVQQGQ